MFANGMTEMTKQSFATLRMSIMRKMSALLDRFAAAPRRAPLSSRSDIPQPKFDLTAGSRAHQPTSHTRQF